MLTIGVKSDLDKLIAGLSALDETQLPFSVARALTMTVQDAQLAVRAKMPSEFTLRQKSFILQGVKIVPARKDNLVAVIYDRDDFMARQETGGDKYPIDGGQNLAVPLAARPEPGVLIPDELRPKNLGKAEYTITRRGKQVARKGVAGTAFRLISNGKTYLALRTAAGLKMMYLLIPTATLKAKLNLGTITQEVVKARFGENFNAALAQAMATRRIGGNLSDKV